MEHWRRRYGLESSNGIIFQDLRVFFVDETSHRNTKLKKKPYGRKIQKTMSNPESLLILVYHGTLIATFAFHLDVFG